MKRRAAHFLLIPELANSPPNEALISAMLEANLYVDVFAPNGGPDLKAYGASVRSFEVEYGYSWLARNLLSHPWHRYSLICATAEDPVGVAGLLARFFRIPLVTLADEIRSGTYAGNRSRRWKSLCRFGMRGSNLTIVNDAARIALQMEYVGLPVRSRIMVYPGAFRNPPRPADRAVTRARKDVSDGTVLLCYSGVFSTGNGALWLASLLKQRADIHVLGHIVGRDQLVTGLLAYLQGGERLHLEPQRLGWREAWSQAAIADVGMVVYLQDAPQFQHMGTSSNRLCMFLSMGVPVIASRQPSFQFIEDFDCGILVDNEDEFIAAIDQIRDRLEPMKANALRCAREYIDAPGKYIVLRDAIAELVGVTPGKTSL